MDSAFAIRFFPASSFTFILVCRPDCLAAPAVCRPMLACSLESRRLDSFALTGLEWVELNNADQCSQS